LSYRRQIAFTGTLNYDQVPVAVALLAKGAGRARNSRRPV
jgi:hypothetical protein